MNTPVTPVCTAEYWSIPQRGQAQLPGIQEHIDTKTKPIGALGQLETLAKSLSLIQGGHSGNYQHIFTLFDCYLFISRLLNIEI